MTEGKKFTWIDWVLVVAGAYFIEEAFLDLTYNDNALVDVLQLIAGSYLVADRVGKSRGWKLPW